MLAAGADPAQSNQCRWPDPAAPHPARVNRTLVTLGSDFGAAQNSRYWPLQGAETGIFLTLALVLAGFCFWWIRRRLPG